MKTQELTDYLSGLILSKSDTVLTDGLYRGKMGLALYLGFYAKVKKCSETRNKTEEIIVDIWNHDPLGLPHNLMEGYLGIAWGMGTLVKERILDYTSVKSFFQHVFSLLRMFGNKGPGYVNWEDHLFSDGLVIEKIRRRSDHSLTRYQSDEHLIYLIDACEDLLACKYSYIELNTHLLNSIVYFLNAMDRLGIYPVKTGLLLDKIPPSGGVNNGDNLLDRLIFHTFTGHVTAPDLSELSPQEAVTLLCKSGFYSLLYNNPLIFNHTMELLQKDLPDFSNQTIVDHLPDLPVGMNGLCGLGYGLLHHKNKKSYANRK